MSSHFKALISSLRSDASSDLTRVVEAANEASFSSMAFVAMTKAELASATRASRLASFRRVSPSRRADSAAADSDVFISASSSRCNSAMTASLTTSFEVSAPGRLAGPLSRIASAARRLALSSSSESALVSRSYFCLDSHSSRASRAFVSSALAAFCSDAIIFSTAVDSALRSSAAKSDKARAPRSSASLSCARSLRSL